MVLREKGTEDWFAGCGDCCATLGIAWPATELPDGTFKPSVAEDTHPAYLSIVDDQDWEAIPVKTISPLHKAVYLEATPDSPDDLVNLHPSEHYGRLTITLKPLSDVLPLLHASCVLAFLPLRRVLM